MFAVNSTVQFLPISKLWSVISLQCTILYMCILITWAQWKQVDMNCYTSEKRKQLNIMLPFKQQLKQLLYSGLWSSWLMLRWGPQKGRLERTPFRWGRSCRTLIRRRRQDDVFGAAGRPHWGQGLECLLLLFETSAPSCWGTLGFLIERNFRPNSHVSSNNSEEFLRSG